MQLRRHQEEFDNIIDGISRGSGVRDIVCHVVPGGGKSTLAIQAGRLIRAGIADKICWICPRASLQDQAERNFIDPFFRKMFGHNLTIRSSTNEVNPSRGTDGFVTTYQALGVDRERTVFRDFERHRYILVLDEFHHLEECGEWTTPIQELYDRAAIRILMTGTLSRGDQKRIAFTPYSGIGNLFTPCFKESDETAIIRYGRKDALRDRAILPLEFQFLDGVARWRKESGKEIEAKISTSRYDANQALYTALATEYAEEMLLAGTAHWQNHKQTINHNARLLVVSASIESAKQQVEILRHRGLLAEIATSDDTKAAVANIKALKTGKLEILVTVAMAYEGLDCPPISHIICLTNIRSMPWIEQMVARAVRIDPLAGPYDDQKGFIFAPADKLFMSLANDIEADQTESLAILKQKKQVAGDGQGDLFGDPRPGITPLSSRLITPKGHFATAPLLGEVLPMRTQRELERELREDIDGHVKRFCRVYACKIAVVNKELKELYGKPREQMTVQELKSLRSYINNQYKIPEQREIIHTVLAPRWR